jgi:DNA-binding MarR family transcriptional regulator
MPPSATFDNLIASGGRLRILAALAAESRLDFVGLRKRTQLTDGNLATHTRRLEIAGFVTVEKSFRDRKPITHMRLTTAGRDALERHARDLMLALGMGRKSEMEEGARTPHLVSGDDREDWVD